MRLNRAVIFDGELVEMEATNPTTTPNAPLNSTPNTPWRPRSETFTTNAPWRPRSETFTTNAPTYANANPNPNPIEQRTDPKTSINERLHRLKDKTLVTIDALLARLESKFDDLETRYLGGGNRSNHP